MTMTHEQTNGGRAGWPRGKRCGWLAAEMRKADIRVALGASELAELRSVVKRLNASGIPMRAWTAQECRTPGAAALLDCAAEDLRWGKGLVIVSGIPVDPERLDQTRALYWVIGSYFGDAQSQNKFGDMLVDVRQGSAAASGRVYASAGPLALHSDRIDMLSLLSVCKAREGGESVFASSITAYEIIARERPDLLPLLERGFRQSRNGEQAEGDEPATPYRVPIFGITDGLLSILRSGNSSRPSPQRQPIDPLTEHEHEALVFLNDVLERPELRFVVQLEPGEAAFINNYEVLHGRTAVVEDDDPSLRRYLMRLWLAGRPSRPLADQQRVVINGSGRQGIDPQPAAAR